MTNNLNDPVRFIIAPDGLTATCVCTSQFDAEQLARQLELQNIALVPENVLREVTVARDEFDRLRHYGYAVEPLRSYPKAGDRSIT